MHNIALMKRYPTLNSRWAGPARAIGTLAVLVSLMAIGARRIGVIEASVLFQSLIAAAILGLAALIMSILAIVHIWNRGGTGLASAFAGSLLSLLSAAPIAVLLVAAILWPKPIDVSTNSLDPPRIDRPEGFDAAVPTAIEVSLAPLRSVLTWIDTTAGTSFTVRLDSSEPEFPDIVSRRYRIRPGRLHLSVKTALTEQGLRIVDELPPDLLDAPTRLQAVGRTPLLGLTDDVAVRIRPDRVGALLDIRSASRSALPDLTGNVERVRNLFAGIDSVLLETYGDLQLLAVSEDELEADGETFELEDREDIIPIPGFKPYFEGAEQDITTTG